MKELSTIVLAGLLGCALAQPASATDSGKFREKLLYSFKGGVDGAYPDELLDVKGLLYSTTGAGGGSGCGGQGCGTVFALDPDSGKEKVIYSFCSQANCTDGSVPWAGLIDVNGIFYGTTADGGAYNEGTVFSVNPHSGAETVLYSFCSRQNCPDGQYPEAGLVIIHGTLYGTTNQGGANQRGVVFSVDLSTGTEKLVYSFCSEANCADGATPYQLTAVKDTVYGAAGGGGASGYGVVFALDPSKGAETVLYSFCSAARCSDGAEPQSPVVSVNGTLYGTTYYGGTGSCAIGNAPGCGTAFALDPETGAQTVLYSLCSQKDCKDGLYPGLGALIDLGGSLYGTAADGGSSDCQGPFFPGCGVAFALDPGTGTETVIHSFDGRHGHVDGKFPTTGLIDVKGTLYGTTAQGGAYGYGTVFRLGD